jgi:hypothetical protein
MVMVELREGKYSSMILSGQGPSSGLSAYLIAVAFCNILLFNVHRLARKSADASSSYLVLPGTTPVYELPCNG